MREVDPPRPGPDDVLVEVHSFGVAGVVLHPGSPESSGFTVGQRVAGVNLHGGPRSRLPTRRSSPSRGLGARTIAVAVGPDSTDASGTSPAAGASTWWSTSWVSVAPPRPDDRGRCGGPPIGAIYELADFGRALVEMDERRTLGTSVVRVR